MGIIQLRPAATDNAMLTKSDISANVQRMVWLLPRIYINYGRWSSTYIRIAILRCEVSKSVPIRLPTLTLR